MKNKKKLITTILIILWLCMIFGHSLMPGEVSYEESGFFTELLLRLFPFAGTAENIGFIIRKAAHFTEFMILGILLTVRFFDSFDKFMKRFMTLAATGLTAAFIDETIQIFVKGRGSSVADMWVDLAGAATGILITSLIVNRRKRKHIGREK